MNDFFRLLRDFVILIPLGVLIFGMFFSLTAITKENLILVTAGLIIFLYGLIASFLRQIYKDYLKFLPIEKSGDTGDLERRKRYHRYHYVAHFLLLAIFVYAFLLFWETIDMNQKIGASTTLSVAPPSLLLPSAGKRSQR